MGSWSSKKPLEAGEPAPEFELKDIAGKLRSSREFLAKGSTLFALFKISCPVCQLTLPYLEKLQDGSLQVVAISQDKLDDTKYFNHEFGITLTTLLDTTAPGYPVSNAFGIANVPSLFLVEPDGKISTVSIGFVKADLENLAARAGVTLFDRGENVPAWKAG